MFTTLLNILNGIFLNISTIIYTVVHSHFVSYSIIAVLSILLAKYLYKFIQQSKSTKKKTGFSLKLIIIYFSFGLVSLFSAWFVCIHFHTFRLL